MTNIEDFNGDCDELIAAVAQKAHFVIVDFYAPWCPGCRRLLQLLPGIAAENQDLPIFKVDIEENAELKLHYNITTIPDVKFMIVEGGKLIELDNVKGPNTTEIRNKIAMYK